MDLLFEEKEWNVLLNLKYSNNQLKTSLERRSRCWGLIKG